MTVKEEIKQIEEETFNKLYEASDKGKSECLLDFIKQSHEELKRSGDGLANSHCWKAYHILKSVLKAEGVVE